VSLRQLAVSCLAVPFSIARCGGVNGDECGGCSRWGGREQRGAEVNVRSGRRVIGPERLVPCFIRMPEIGILLQGEWAYAPADAEG